MASCGYTALLGKLHVCHHSSSPMPVIETVSCRRSSHNCCKLRVIEQLYACVEVDSIKQQHLSSSSTSNAIVARATAARARQWLVTHLPASIWQGVGICFGPLKPSGTAPSVRFVDIVSSVPCSPDTHAQYVLQPSRPSNQVTAISQLFGELTSKTCDAHTQCS